MPQVNIDPIELRRFAQNLKQFTNELSVQMAGIQRHAVGLSATWRDQEHKKFCDEFELQMQALNRFMESTTEYIPFLMRKAERAEEYLQQR